MKVLCGKCGALAEGRLEARPGGAALVCGACSAEIALTSSQPAAPQAQASSTSAATSTPLPTAAPIGTPTPTATPPPPPTAAPIATTPTTAPTPTPSPTAPPTPPPTAASQPALTPTATPPPTAAPTSTAAAPADLASATREAWAQVRTRWDDEEAHRAFLARFDDLDGLAEAGRRYREVLSERPGDGTALRWRDEILKRATAQGLSQLPRLSPPRVSPKLYRWAVLGGMIGAMALAAGWLAWRLLALARG